jgi:hypothetical protein
MVMDLDAIPPLRGPRPRGAARARRRPQGDRRRTVGDTVRTDTGGRTGEAATRTGAPAGGVLPGRSRRSVLANLTRAATALGLTALGVFPPARTAFAEGFRLAPDGYKIHPSCPSYAQDHDCSPGCGPSLVCSDCCRTSGPMAGMHHSSVSASGFRLRPNECYSDSDGWLWRYEGRCGECTGGIVWRCHDGWKRSDSGHWYKTICRWPVECNQ